MITKNHSGDNCTLRTFFSSNQSANVPGTPEAQINMKVIRTVGWEKSICNAHAKANSAEVEQE
jgi:hypothetical protein